MSRQTDFQRELERIKKNDERKPLRERRWAGVGNDYLIIDEFGRTVWASDWCRKAYKETIPRGRLR